VTDLTYADLPCPPIPLIVKQQTQAVDWLTITAKSGGARRGLYELATEQLQTLRELGNNCKPWNFQGYTGLQCRGYRWGTRLDSDILVLSGDQAGEYWHPALALAENVTRVDLAVTVLLRHPETEFAWNIYLALQGKVDGRKKCRKFTLVTDNAGGQTLYVGSRSSDQMGRLYDKGRQDLKRLDLEPGLMWRYEVEFKSSRAKRVAAQLLALPPDGARFGNTVARTVQEWFFTRGVPSLLLTDPGEEIALSVGAKVTDDLITLEWLSTQVRPSIARLVGKGKADQVVAALGMGGLDNLLEL